MTTFDYYFQRSCPVDYKMHIHHAFITIFERRLKYLIMSSLNELSTSSSSIYWLAAFAPSSLPPVFVPTFFNFQVVALAAVGKYFGLQARPGFHVFEIRSGHPLISRLAFCFSLLLLFFVFLFRSLVIYSQCYFCSGCLFKLFFVIFTFYLQPHLGFQCYKGF